jgi:hypothetical protein
VSDAIIRWDGEVNTAPKLRVNHHGWVEHHDETGSIFALTPPHVVEDLLINVDLDEEENDE